MVAQNDTTAHLSAERMAKLAAAFGDTDKALADRALHVHMAVYVDNVDVKTIAADMADAHRADDAIPAVSAATLGFAKFASTVAELVGADLRAWHKRSAAEVALIVRAGKRAGLKVATTAIRDALKPLESSDITGRTEVALTVATTLRSSVLPAKESTPRESAADTGAEVDADGTPVVAEPAGIADAIATVRAVTAWLNTGGSWTPELESALAELRGAATDARKRGTRAKQDARPGATAAA